MQRPTLSHIIIKLLKDKDNERILKTIREEWFITYKRSSIGLSANFSLETLEAKRQWVDVFKVLKEKYCQIRIVHPEKLSFKNQGEVKTFLDK